MCFFLFLSHFFLSLFYQRRKKWLPSEPTSRNSSSTISSWGTLRNYTIRLDFVWINVSLVKGLSPTVSWIFKDRSGQIRSIYQINQFWLNQIPITTWLCYGMRLLLTFDICFDLFRCVFVGSFYLVVVFFFFYCMFSIIWFALFWIEVGAVSICHLQCGTFLLSEW